MSTPSSAAALLACAAGKDVYVEKPMSLFIQEGRWMTTAVRRYKRIVCPGAQSRNGSHMREVVPLFKEGYAGRIASVRFGPYRNIMPGFGRPGDGPPPTGMAYAMWLGPAPMRPNSTNRVLYHFRWFWDQSRAFSIFL